MFIPLVIKVPHMSVETVILTYAAQEDIAFCVRVDVVTYLVVVEAEETEEAEAEVVLQEGIADPAELVEGEEVSVVVCMDSDPDSFAENL
jgi:hypothetical protein